MATNTRNGLLRRLLRLGVASTASASGDDPTAVGELETELALLREENAWLKVERHRPPDTGRIVERMRELAQDPSTPSPETEGLPTEDATQLMIECLRVRDGLLEACEEVKQAMAGIRGRLSGLSADVQAVAGGPAMPAPSSVNGALAPPIAIPTGALEPPAGELPATDLSQSVA